MWPIYEKLHCCAVLIIIKNDKSTDINVECERLSSGIKGVEQPHRTNQNIYSGHFRNTYEKIIWSRDYVTCLGELLDGLRTICREYALKIWRLCINKLAKGRKPERTTFLWRAERSRGHRATYCHEVKGTEHPKHWFEPFRSLSYSPVVLAPHHHWPGCSCFSCSSCLNSDTLDDIKISYKTTFDNPAKIRSDASYNNCGIKAVIFRLVWSRLEIPF